VERLEESFVEAVQRNVRVRVLSNAVDLLRMGAYLNYSRTDRLGHLYDEFFYKGRAPVAERLAAANGPSVPSALMSDLFTQPRGEPAAFRVREGNARRGSKVPMLFMNCTTLNTGRHWIFAPEWMGECFFDTQREHTDKNAVLHGLYYKEATLPRHREFKLGMAVAASSCVPVLFPPLPIKGIFDDWMVQLVDGGVHDNQGLTIVEEYDSEAVLVSDASMQMGDTKFPGTFPVDVYDRTYDVLMDRSRDRNAAAIVRRPAHRPGAVVHLKQGLTRDELLIAPRALEPLPDSTDLNPAVQKLLASMRTDLDFFSDIECDALMAAGYALAAKALPADSPFVTFVNKGALSGERRGNWRFAWILPELRAENPSARVMRHLRASSSRFLRLLRILPWLAVIPVAAALAVVGAGVWYVATHWQTSAFSCAITTGELTIGVIVALALAATLRFSSVWLRVRKAVLVIGALLVAWPASNLFLWLVHPVYKRVGRRPGGAARTETGGNGAGRTESSGNLGVRTARNAGQRTA
jgi:hypothetical protein